MNEKNSQNQNVPTKEELLADIEKLIRYDESDAQTINPSLLAYLDETSLVSIKKGLLGRVGVLSEEDKKWLQQFKKFE